MSRAYRHVMERFHSERFNGSPQDKVVWLTLIEVTFRHGTLGSVQAIVGHGPYRIVAGSGQLVVGGHGRPNTFVWGASQANEKKIDRSTVIALYQRASLWQETVRPLDWPAVARWFARFENYNPEAQGATRAQIETAMAEAAIGGWTDQTLEDLVRKSKVNKVDGYYFLSRISWAEVAAWAALGLGVIAGGAHLFL